MKRRQALCIGAVVTAGLFANLMDRWFYRLK